MVAMRVTAQNDLEVLDFEPELCNGVADHRIVTFVIGVDDDVTLRRGDEKTRQALGANVVHVADDFVRWELCVLLFRAADISCEEFRDGPHARSLSSKKRRAETHSEGQAKCFDSYLHAYGLYGRDAALTMALRVGMSFNSGALLLNDRMYA